MNLHRNFKNTVLVYVCILILGLCLEGCVAVDSSVRDHPCANISSMYRNAYSQGLKKPFGVPEMAACFKKHDVSLEAAQMILEENGFKVKVFRIEEDPEFFEKRRAGLHFEADDTANMVGSKKTFGMFPDIWVAKFYFKKKKMSRVYGDVDWAITAL